MIIMYVCNSFLEYHFIFVLSLSDLWEIHKSVMIMVLDRASSSVQWQTPANTKMQKYIPFSAFCTQIADKGWTCKGEVGRSSATTHDNNERH